MHRLILNDGRPEIGAIYAWSALESDGTEGLIASSTVFPGMLSPLMATDAERARKMDRWVRDVLRVRSVPASLIHFVRTETILRIEP